MVNGRKQLEPSRFTIQNRYISDMVGRLKTYQSWLEDPDQAMKVDRSVYDKIERDPVIEKARQIRRHKVGGAKWSLIPFADEEGLMVPVFEHLIKHIRRFDTAKANLADAFFKGMTICQIQGEFREMVVPGDNQSRRWWVPTQLVDMDKERFLYEFNENMEGAWTVFDFKTNYHVEIDRKDYIMHRYDTRERGLGTSWGAGIAGRLVYYWMVKTIVWDIWMRGAERWGFGWIVAKLSSSLGGFSTTDLATYSATVNQVITQLEKQRENHILVHDAESVQVETIEPSGTGHQVCTDIINHIDDAMTSLILGSSMPSGGGGDAGSYARAETEADTTESVVGYDRSILAETLTTDLLECIRRVNHGNLVAMGLGGLSTPKLVLRSEKIPNHLERAQVIAQAQQIGLDVKKLEAYEELGLTAPDKEDEILSPQQQQQQSNMENPSSPFRAFFKQGEACETGETAKNTGCIPAKKKKKASPGSQLPADVITKLDQLQVKNRPTEDILANDVRVDFSGDTDAKSVLSWRDKNGKIQHGYTKGFEDRNAKTKWETVKNLEGKFEGIKEDLVLRLGEHEPGSIRHQSVLVTAIIAQTGLRVGNKGSFEKGRQGVAFLKRESIKINGDTVSFDFIGKSGKRNTATIQNGSIVEAISFYNEGEPGSRMFNISPDNARKETDGKYKLKDLRTLNAGIWAKEGISRIDLNAIPGKEFPEKRRKHISKELKKSDKFVAENLNNTPTVARRSYINPYIYEEFLMSLGVPKEDVHKYRAFFNDTSTGPEPDDPYDDDDMADDGSVDVETFPLPTYLEKYWNEDDETESDPEVSQSDPFFGKNRPLNLLKSFRMTRTPDLKRPWTDYLNS